MANLNKTVVIQLADAGVYDIVTEFDVRNEHWSSGCPTCGSADFEMNVATASIVSTEGVTEVTFVHEQSGCSEAAFKQMLPTQADLMKLLLNSETLEMLKGKTLEDFASWLEYELDDVYREKDLAYWEALK